MTEILSCRQFEEWLSECEAGALPPEAAAAMRQHARACVACGELLADVRQTSRLLADLPPLEPSPRLRAAILERTTGRRELVSWRETLRSLRGLLWQPRVAMSFGMALFACAILLNATGVNLRQLQWSDLAPRQIVLHTERGLHRGWARGAKYYNDLKVVYEIQAALHTVWRQPAAPAPVGGRHRNRINPPRALRGVGPVFARMEYDLPARLAERTS